MGTRDLNRLKADASGNTALSERLEQAVGSFSGPQDALDFLASRGFEVTASELRQAVAEEAARKHGLLGEGEGGFGALLRFMDTGA